jgi:hypothetical protein
MTVVLDDNPIKRSQGRPLKVHLDTGGLGIEGIPDEFGNRHDRRGLSSPLQVVGLDLDFRDPRHGESVAPAVAVRRAHSGNHLFGV